MSSLSLIFYIYSSFARTTLSGQVEVAGHRSVPGSSQEIEHVFERLKFLEHYVLLLKYCEHIVLTMRTQRKSGDCCSGLLPTQQGREGKRRLFFRLENIILPRTASFETLAADRLDSFSFLRSNVYNKRFQECSLIISARKIDRRIYQI